MEIIGTLTEQRESEVSHCYKAPLHKEQKTLTREVLCSLSFGHWFCCRT